MTSDLGANRTALCHVCTFRSLVTLTLFHFLSIPGARDHRFHRSIRGKKKGEKDSLCKGMWPLGIVQSINLPAHLCSRVGMWQVPRDFPSISRWSAIRTVPRICTTGPMHLQEAALMSLWSLERLAHQAQFLTLASILEVFLWTQHPSLPAFQELPEELPVFYRLAQG